jgi:hypothetical protein
VADFDLADAALLQLPDLPAGWTVEADEEDSAADDRLFECYGAEDDVEAVIRNDEAEAERSFESGGAHLSASVTVYPTVEYAAASFDPIRDPNFAECFRRTFQEEIGRDTSATVEVRAEALPVPALGDDAGGLRFPVTLSGPGGQVTTAIDLVIVRDGRAIAGLTTLSLAEPFDPALLQRLLTLIAERLEPL